MHLVPWFVPDHNKNRLLQFENLTIAAYIWGNHITHTYDTPEADHIFKLFTAYLFATLLAAYPANLFHFLPNWGFRATLQAIILAIQAFLFLAFYNSVREMMDSAWMLLLNLFIITVSVNIASIFPITADFLLIITQYVCGLMYTYKTGAPSFVSYFGPLWLLSEAVVMSFGISELERCKKCKLDNFQAILGLNDAQLSYVLLVLFALLTNMLDYFQGVGHLLPLLTFPLAIPAIYTQLDCNHSASRILTLIFFLLYTAAYHTVKIIAYQQTVV